jgi:DNA-directed RNA polymerase specialized sigma24 family protein
MRASSIREIDLAKKLREAMCWILIDSARKKRSENRGGKHGQVEWHDNIEAPSRPTDDLLALHEALSLLAQEDPETAQLVKLRLDAGLSVEDAADAMGLARATAYRTWSSAKAWLRTQLGDGSSV